MGDKHKYKTRMGDGSLVYLTEEEIIADIEEGVADGVSRGKVQPLSQEDKDKILEIVKQPGNMVGVEAEDAVVTTSDSGCIKMHLVCEIPMDRSTGAMINERIVCSDSVDIGLQDYNYKTVKGIAKREAMIMKTAMDVTTLPIFYGAMPNLGFYTKPDGPVENWAELLPEGRIEEALKAQEEAIDYSVKDILFVADNMNAVGADGFQLDTCGAAGDADLLVGLLATEKITEKYPDLPVIMGMAGEFVLGMHGRLKYKGKRLAGLYVHDQVKLCEEAGASIFGAVVNTNCSKTFPWNIAKSCTLIKACTDVAKIPVHADVGMGVNGIPMCEVIPVDIVSRADRCLIEICKVDGL